MVHIPRTHVEARDGCALLVTLVLWKGETGQWLELAGHRPSSKISDRSCFKGLRKRGVQQDSKPSLYLCISTRTCMCSQTCMCTYLPSKRFTSNLQDKHSTRLPGEAGLVLYCTQLPLTWHGLWNSQNKDTQNKDTLY